MARALWIYVQRGANLGFIPEWIDEMDPRPATEQLDAGYQFGMGWHFEGFKGPANAKDLCQGGGMPALTLKYPGDPAMRPLAYCLLPLTKEIVVFYESAWVAVWQQDGSFKIQRMD